jgi:hypothetical protein
MNLRVQEATGKTPHRGPRKWSRTTNVPTELFSEDTRNGYSFLFMFLFNEDFCLRTYSIRVYSAEL